ncbi:MAG: SURF1 family protein [Gammaproteobacteria bacterium]|nr:SURF1 family protein [Gammaproteobacteria bacterium]
MRIGAFDFNPGFWPSIVTLALLPFLAGLGIWQLERASWKQGLVDQHAESARQPPLLLQSLLARDEPLQYRQVTVRGRYDLEHQLLLDNRTFKGHAGYHVLTPLLLGDRENAVLVNRGWVPVGEYRSRLPELPGPAGELMVYASIKLPPEKLFRLDAVEEVHEGWPQVVQQMKLSELEQRLGYSLLPVILLLDPVDEYGFVREWKAVYGVTPGKHRAYALQWFMLALVLLMIYIGVNSKRISDET